MLTYLFRVFLVIGSTSFGGYMSLIAMIRNKLVERDKVIEDEVITEAITLSSLLPGPVAVNVVAYVGYLLAGVSGATLSVIAVLLPSFALVVFLSFLYFQYQTVFDFNSLLSGVIPVVIGVIFAVGASMAKKVCTKAFHYLIGIISIGVLYLIPGYWPIICVLLLAGLLGILINVKKVEVKEVPRSKRSYSVVWVLVGFAVLYLTMRFALPDSITARLFAEFSAVSLTLFGGGYVMVPILKNMLVDQFAWLSYREFAFGISIGQVTPGPILISAAYFGYKMNGFTGALVSTIGIFFPSSVLMIIASTFYQQLRNSRFLQAALTGIKPAVVGLIIYSGIALFLSHLENNDLWFPAIIALISFISIFRFNINPAFIVIAGGMAGYLLNKL
jgi:chromate transporter